LELLFERNPSVSSESWLRPSLYIYFLDELKERPVKEIVDALVLGEATDDEMNNVASLADMCLKFRGGRDTP
jgi:hypothetical protein